MKNLLLGILTCLILTCCESNHKEIEYYKVEEFEIIKENIKTNVDGGYHKWYYGYSNLYKICLSNKTDTIQEEYITTIKQRFYKGDSVYYNDFRDCYYLKN